MTPDRPYLDSEHFFESRIDPMVPRPTIRPISNKDWIAEIKLNGFRAITYLGKDQSPVIRTGVGRNVGQAFPELTPGLIRLSERHSLILDGEIVYGEGKTTQEMRVAVGRTSGTAFTARANSEKFPCQYAVFDLLYLDGQDLTQIPLSQRNRILARIINRSDAKHQIIRVPHVRTDKKLHEVARQDGYEGVVYKNPRSLYVPGEKTWDWLKYKFK